MRPGGARVWKRPLDRRYLGLPTGMLSILDKSVSEQNALIISALLIDKGAVDVPIGPVPTLLNRGSPVVISGMPTFESWEPASPGPGRIPAYRTDTGALLTAEAFGASTLIYAEVGLRLFERRLLNQDALALVPPTGTTEPHNHRRQSAAAPGTPGQRGVA